MICHHASTGSDGTFEVELHCRLDGCKQNASISQKVSASMRVVIGRTEVDARTIGVTTNEWGSHHA